MLQPPHLLYVVQSTSCLASDFFIISNIFPNACDDKTFTIRIFIFSPFIAPGTNIVKLSTFVIPSPSNPLSIISTIYSLFFSTGTFSIFSPQNFKMFLSMF